jgi:hypothetical protein
MYHGRDGSCSSCDSQRLPGVPIRVNLCSSAVEVFLRFSAAIEDLDPFAGRFTSLGIWSKD